MKTEIVFNKRRVTEDGSWYDWLDYDFVNRKGDRICSSSLRAEVHLPLKQTKFVAVFNTKQTAQCFTITVPYNGTVWYGRHKNLDRSTVDINTVFSLETQYLLAAMYNKGYRYVRIEY